jgi:hypothetical protein
MGDHSISHSKQKSVDVHVLFQTGSETELFHCTVPKLLRRKRYYVLFLMLFKFSVLQTFFNRHFDIFSNSFQSPMMSTLASKLPKAANSFEILTWYYSLNSTLFSFFGLNSLHTKIYIFVSLFLATISSPKRVDLMYTWMQSHLISILFIFTEQYTWQNCQTLTHLQH